MTSREALWHVFHFYLKLFHDFPQFVPTIEEFKRVIIIAIATPLLLCWSLIAVAIGDSANRVIRSSVYKKLDCATSKVVSPCRCHNDAEGNIYAINCTGVYSDLIDLKILSQRLSEQLFSDRESARCVIEKLVIHNSAVKQIRSNVFNSASKTISFVEIELIDIKLLEFIDRTAFDGSTETLKSLQVVNNNRLYASDTYAPEIWQFVSKFKNLEMLKISHVNIGRVPTDAFSHGGRDMEHLKHVEITYDNIHSIDDFAFRGLTAPSLRLWLNNNKISTISRNALKFKNMPNHVIRLIDLSNNLLTADSFEAEAFTGMGRPLATLILRNNQIETLYEHVFRPLFDRSEKNYFQLEIGSKQVHCQCSLQWIHATKYCYDEGKAGHIADQIFEIDCRQSLSDCGYHSEQLSPACLRNNQNSAFSLSFNHCLFAFNFIIVFRLIYKNFNSNFV